MRSGNMARESRAAMAPRFPPGKLLEFRSGDAGACPLGGRLFLDADRMLEVLLQDLAGFEVERERQFLDELVLLRDRRVDIGIDHEAAAIAFELIVDDVAEMQ